MMRYYTYSPLEKVENWDMVASFIRAIDSDTYQNVFLIWTSHACAEAESHVHRICENILSEIASLQPDEFSKYKYEL